MARNAIESEFRTSKMADRSEMARNVIEGDFQTSKIAAAGHFVKNLKTKLWYRSEMARNAIKSYFWTSKMATGVHLKKDIHQKSCASDLNNVRTDCWPTTTWYKFTFGQYIYIYKQVYWERGQGRIQEIVGGGVQFLCNQGPSPWCRDEVPSGGGYGRGVCPLPM